MKILIANDSGFAHYFERMGLAKALKASGHEVYFWNIHQEAAFDVFGKFAPDIFVGQAYNLKDDIIECLRRNPQVKVALKAGDWGSFYDNWTETMHTQFPILMASKAEKIAIDKLRQFSKPDLIFIHYHPDYVAQTHNYWGLNTISMMNAADIFDYTNGKHVPELASDIAFVGGYWGYKSFNLNKYILPLCNPNNNLNIKIFGNQPWPVSQYCGAIDTNLVKHVFSSAKICPNISEPHSTEFGFDIIERPFKLLSNKCFVISDNVAGMRDLFDDSIVFAESPKDFQEKVMYYLKHSHETYKFIQNGYYKVMKEHTYFDRAAHLLSSLGFGNEVQNILDSKNKVIGEIEK